MIRLMLKYRIGPRTAWKVKRLLQGIGKADISFSTKSGEGFSDGRVTLVRRIER